MNNRLTYEWFSELSLPERVDWIDAANWHELSNLHSRQIIKHFFTELYQKEKNAYLRNKAVEYIADLTLLNVIRYDFTKDFLLEEVEEADDSFIGSTRLKYLFLLFGDDLEVYQSIAIELANDNLEIASEAYFRIGLIHLLYRANQSDSVNIISELEHAEQLFVRAQSLSENRIDAQFFQLVTQYLLELLAQNLESSQRTFNGLLQIFWQRQVWGLLPDSDLLEYSILHALKSLKLIAESVIKEATWLDYKNEFSLLSKFFSDLVATNLLNTKFLKTYKEFSLNPISYILDQYYINNLSACQTKINSLISDIDPSEAETISFLTDLKERLSMNQKKNDTPIKSVAKLHAVFPHLSLQEVTQDVAELFNDGKSEIIIEAELAFRYIPRLYYNRTYFRTGYVVGDEVLKSLILNIKQCLPDYPPSKLTMFIDVLSDIVRYNYQSFTQSKEFFPYLYDSSITDEKVFQRHLYERLTGGERATYYKYESSNFIGGGRIDIVYSEQEITFPIEIKKTDKPPTWDTICNDYVAQVHTYTYPYNQLGILIVFDLSSKANGKPVNDFRELFNILQLTPYYRIPNTYPDYVIAAIVPGNKINPSKYTKYN